MSAAPSPSPRPSLSLRSPASSRTSLDLPASNASSLARPANSRRNRAALRDYYGIKGSSEDISSEHDGSEKAAPGNVVQQQQSLLNELDKEGFEAGAYVKSLLEHEGLEGLLKVEGSLVGEIRGLDGERKALVYDNYSKLIAATETIKKMRKNMDPLTPTTSTLTPAIAHIAETAASILKDLESHVPPPHEVPLDAKEKQRQTVRWLLDAPRRLSRLLDEDRRDDAEQDWAEVRALLTRWKAIRGAEELKQACEQVLERLKV